MFSRSAVAALICMLIATVSGCRLLDGRFADGDRPPEALSPRILNALRAQLREDEWRQNPEWSLIDDTQTLARMRNHRDRLRWKYVQPVAVELLKRLDDRRLAARYLQELARDDGIVGWNATILLTQRQSLIAADYSDRLEELVSSRLWYDPNTGKRTQRVAPETKSDTGNKTKSPSRDPARLKTHSDRELFELAGESATHSPSNSQPNYWEKLLKAVQQPFSEAEPAPKSVVAASPNLQSAAAEAWCRALTAEFGKPIVNLAPVARALRRVKLPIHIREELLRGSAEFVKPARIPRIKWAFPEGEDETKSSKRLQRAAMEACVIFARAQYLNPPARTANGRLPVEESAWPIWIDDRKFDPDPQMRILYGRWAALTHHNNAGAILAEQQRDIQPHVQEAALVSMGLWNGAEAKSILKDAANNESARWRAAAAIGLSRWGPVESARFLNDSSETVRVAVAASLADTPSPDSAALLNRLMRTSTDAVQLACVSAVKDWPDVLAIPLLIDGMRDGQGVVISKSWKALRDRKKLRDRFPVSKPEADRRVALERLIAKYNFPVNRMPRSVMDILEMPVGTKHQLRAMLDRDLKTLRDSRPGSLPFRDAAARLERLDRRALPELEKRLAPTWRNYPDELTADILPKLNPVYAHLWKLSDRDPLIRQRAAASLAAYAENVSLSPLMLGILEDRISARPDRNVWRSAMQAVMRESRPEQRWLVIQASQFPVPEIRRLACEYFGKHPEPDFADRVLELMNDGESRAVQLAAVQAAGRYHHPSILNGTQERRKKPKSSTVDDRIPRRRLGLLELLRSSDRELEEAAAISLARLGHETGYRELQRMSFDDDGRKRAHAYRLMGETGARRFVEHLIHRGQKEQSHHGRRAILAALEELTATDERPVGLSNDSGYDKRIQLWQTWLQRRKSPAANLKPLRSSAAYSQSEQRR